MAKNNIELQKDIEKYINIEKKSFNFFTLILVVALIIAVIISLIFFRLFLSSQTKLKKFTSNLSSQTTPTQEEIKKITSQVGKHIILPAESPQVITVTNVETLKKDQPFFNQAQNGHKLLIYQNKVIIFDPVEDKIVDIAYIKPTELPPSPTLSPTETPRISNSPALRPKIPSPSPTKS